MIIPIHPIKSTWTSWLNVNGSSNSSTEKTIKSTQRFNMGLVRILWDDRHELNTASRNVWLLYLRDAVVHHGWESKIFHELSVEDAVSILKQEDFNAVGFTVHVLNIQETLKVCEQIKKELPHVFIALGGHHASWSADNLLQLDYVDSVFVWEGEVTIKEFIDDINQWRMPKKKICS